MVAFVTDSHPWKICAVSQKNKDDPKQVLCHFCLRSTLCLINYLHWDQAPCQPLFPLEFLEWWKIARGHGSIEGQCGRPILADGGFIKSQVIFLAISIILEIFLKKKIHEQPNKYLRNEAKLKEMSVGWMFLNKQACCSLLGGGAKETSQTI